MIAFSILLSVPFIIGADAAILRKQDGILAKLYVTSTDASLSWRFTRRPPGLLDKVEAKVDGRATGIPLGYEPFPAQGESALVTFLIDTGDLARAKAIDGAGRAILETLKSLPLGVQARIATYDTDYHAIELARFAADPGLAGSVREAASDLSAGLIGAIDAAPPIPGTRRAIYVYTDGANADPRGLAVAQKRAVIEDIDVSFVLKPGTRLADVNALRDFATLTGGRLMSRDQDAKDAIAFLASGGRVIFPFATNRRFFWQPEAIVEVALTYDGRRLVLSSPVALAPARTGETLEYLWHQFGFGVVGGLAAAAVIVAALLHRRSRRAKVAGPRSSLSAKP